MGLIASILKRNGEDCSNGGLSSRANGVCIVNVDGPFEPSADYPAVKLVKRPRVGNVVCEPLAEHERGEWLMAGGCYVTTSDSRFSEAVQRMSGYQFGFPVALHDRIER